MLSPVCQYWVTVTVNATCVWNLEGSLDMPLSDAVSRMRRLLSRLRMLKSPIAMLASLGSMVSPSLLTIRYISRAPESCSGPRLSV
ncbi:hypothetical protein GBAR_LOCUS16425 [Geodia barretti]|uniref:Uncharacterized protein n=1 Tax=Geodia barretti TaxID=519541 RepID=A0AA35SGB2_GEOBA|nr:hypothetical protein GBAR_LOCUS16425 [Geodia barretti]